MSADKRSRVKTPPGLRRGPSVPRADDPAPAPEVDVALTLVGPRDLVNRLGDGTLHQLTLPLTVALWYLPALPMTSIDEIRTLLRRGRIAEVEEACLEALEKTTYDLELFTAAARGLVGAGEEERAALIVDLLDEKLVAAALWEDRLQLLRVSGHIRCQPEEEHALLLEILHQVYPGSTTLDGLIETVGLHRATGDRLKSWKKVDRLRVLMRYDLGAIVMMKGRGVGEVVEANIPLQKFKVDFHGHGGLRVGFAAAAKLLIPLDSNHILRRKWEGIEALAKLAREAPTDLLRDVLESYSNPLTAGEIRDILSGVVKSSSWTSWWSAARKHPQVVVQTGGRATYTWAESADHMLASFETRFAKADMPGKITIYRQAIGRDADLSRRMGLELASEANLLVSRRPETALAIRHVLARAGGPLDELTWSMADLIGDSSAAARLLPKVTDRQLREVLVRAIAETCDAWADVLAEHLPREEVPRVLDLMATELETRDAERWKRVVLLLMSQPQTNPAAFVWMAERAAVDDEIRELGAFRLLQQILRSLSMEPFRSYRVRLLKLFDSGGTVPRLLPLLDARTAAQAEEAIQRSAALDNYVREPLLTAIHLRFPTLRGETDQPIYALSESIAARRKQLKELLEVEIPTNRTAIQVAREMGDLRENFEYKAARQRHEYLSARANTLNGELGRARPIDLSTIDTREVRIGCRVEIESSGGRRDLTLLGPWESRPEDGIISYESEIGRSLLGRRSGDTVELGETAGRIVAISPWVAS